VAVYDAGSSRGAIVSALLVSALVFFIVDGNLWVQTIRGLDAAFWNFEVPRNDPRTVRIQVNAHQWAWEARYAGPDARFGTEDDVLRWNDLPVPVGVPISLQLASVDVIHNLYLPNFRVKMDAVPGQVNRMWFQAKEEGEFEIACAQHCGTSHYKMKGLLRVLPEVDYRAWEAEAAENARRAFDPEDTTAHWAWEWKESAR
jgi:cytochrome c oxidase subunit 2